MISQFGEKRKISLIFFIWIIVTLLCLPTICTSPINSAQNGDEDMIVSLNSNTLKSILLYNRLNQLIKNEPEMLDLFDLDRGQLNAIIEELLNQSKISQKFLKNKNTKRAGMLYCDFRV